MRPAVPGSNGHSATRGTPRASVLYALAVDGRRHPLAAALALARRPARLRHVLDRRRRRDRQGARADKWQRRNGVFVHATHPRGMGRISVLRSHFSAIPVHCRHFDRLLAGQSVTFLP